MFLLFQKQNITVILLRVWNRMIRRFFQDCCCCGRNDRVGPENEIEMPVRQQAANAQEQPCSSSDANDAQPRPSRNPTTTTNPTPVHTSSTSRGHTNHAMVDDSNFTPVTAINSFPTSVPFTPPHYHPDAETSSINQIEAGSNVIPGGTSSPVPEHSAIEGIPIQETMAYHAEPYPVDDGNAAMPL
jgi:hypothetical protein